MEKWIIGYGLNGGFGGARDYEVIEANDEDEASAVAWEKACENYESYAGSNGLRSIEEIMEEDDVEEDEAEGIYEEERESWLDYSAQEYTDELAKEIADSYGLHNPFEN